MFINYIRKKRLNDSYSNILIHNDRYIEPIRWILNNKEQGITNFEMPLPNIIIPTFSNVFLIFNCSR